MGWNTSKGKVTGSRTQDHTPLEDYGSVSDDYLLLIAGLFLGALTSSVSTILDIAIILIFQMKD